MTDIQVNQTSTMDEQRKKREQRQKVLKIVYKVFIYAFLTFVAFMSILPFYWMIITSLKQEGEYRQSVPTFFPHIMNWKNYSYVITYGKGIFGTALLNTIIVGVVSTILSLIIMIITAYAFAKMEFKGKNLLFTILLATMMIPGELYTTTNYITVGANGLGWNNTYVVMIVPFLVSVYYIYLLRNNFMQIPNSLYQAAKVDGTSDLGFLIKVMIPLTAPTLISVTLLKFIGTWNSYIWPELVNKKSEWRLISNWMQSTGFTDPKGVLSPVIYNESMTTLKMAAACMVSLPLFILFIFFRKYIMRGVSRSGTKG
ncbi:MAG: carbohydrate ABC transporter permease [Anaeroplasma sp.]